MDSQSLEIFKLRVGGLSKRSDVTESEVTGLRQELLSEIL